MKTLFAFLIACALTSQTSFAMLSREDKLTNRSLESLASAAASADIHDMTSLSEVRGKADQASDLTAKNILDLLLAEKILLSSETALTKPELKSEKRMRVVNYALLGLDEFVRRNSHMNGWVTGLAETKKMAKRALTDKNVVLYRSEIDLDIDSYAQMNGTVLVFFHKNSNEFTILVAMKEYD